MEQDRIAEAGSVAVAAGSLLELLDLGVDGLEMGVGESYATKTSPMPP